MIKISLIYLLIMMISIGIILCYTSMKYFNTGFKDVIFINIFLTITISVIFLLVFENKIDFLEFGLYISLISIAIHVFGNSENFKILLFNFKSYYLFLLSFTTVFSLYETLSKINIYILLEDNNKFLAIFLSSVVLYFFTEALVLKKIDINKFEYIFSTTNVFIPISMFVLLISKNYSFFYILNFSKHSYLVSVLFLASMLLEVYFAIFMIIGISKSYDLSIYKHKNNILNMQYELQVNNLKELEKHQGEIRKISHDINNHKIIIYNLIKDKEYDEALKYIESFGSGFRNDTYEVFTNHKILNSLFLKKKEISLNSNIDFKLDINLPKKIEISDFDLCIIVGNLIDNAIEACKRSAKDSNKHINIKSKIINENFVLEISNGFDGEVKSSGKRFLTQKRDKLNHGLGLSNVEDTVKKYKGQLEIKAGEKEFTALVIIPLS